MFFPVVGGFMVYIKHYFKWQVHVNIWKEKKKGRYNYGEASFAYKHIVLCIRN